MEARRELAAANRADILALQHIIEKIRKLKSGIRLHPCKLTRYESIKEMIHPIISQDTFNSIVHRSSEKCFDHTRKYEYT